MSLKPKNTLELALATAVSAWFIAVVACTAPVSSPAVSEGTKAISEAVEEALKAFLEHPLLVLDDRAWYNAQIY